MKKILGIALLVAVGTLSGKAQDIHFSQFDLSPVNLNPSLTGDFAEDYRLHVNQRTQWRSITVPYQTFSASFDMAIRPAALKRSSIGAGILFNTDKAGDGAFGTTQVKLAAAWHQDMRGDSVWILSGGLNFAFNQHSVNYNAFYFNSQYNGYSYDPTLPTYEVFPDDQMQYLDFSFGLYTSYRIKPKLPVFGGIALHHLNKPQQSFFEDSEIELDRKFNFFAGSQIQAGENVTLWPSVAWFRQGKLQELNVGGYVQRHLNSISFRAIWFGGWFRMKDAGILSIGFDYQNWRMGLSYDFNLSNLKVASNGRGGLELALRYVFSNPRGIKLPPKHTCPPYL